MKYYMSLTSALTFYACKHLDQLLSLLIYLACFKHDIYMCMLCDKYKT